MSMGDRDIERETVGGFVAVVEYDPGLEWGDVDNPRDWCNVGRMLCSHRRYTLGDGPAPEWYTNAEGESVPCESWADVLTAIRQDLDAPDAVALPLGLIDHSGLSMWAGAGAHVCDPGGWDSGQVGWIVATADGVADCVGADATADEIADALRGEVATYDAYLRGDVIGWRVESPAGDYDSRDVIAAVDELRGEVVDAVRDAAQAAHDGGTVRPGYRDGNPDAYADHADSLDPVALVEYVRGSWPEVDDTADVDELAFWAAFAAEGESETADWTYGAACIRDDAFEDYAQELAEDIGAISRDASWPLNRIDWAAAADDLKVDYGTVEVDGSTWWVG